LTNPATVKLDVDKAVEWVQKGAQPTDTARDLLSSKGVMLKKHLLRGVRKGALTEEEAEKKFKEGVEEKEGKLSDRREAHQKSQEAAKAKALEAEKKVSEKRAAEAQPEEEEAVENASQEEGEEAPAESQEEDNKTEI